MAMKRICWLLKVRSDRIEEYKELHRNVWPDLLQALRDTGWTNYSLYLREDGLLIGYLETEDFQAALDGMAKLEVNSRWQAVAGPLFEQLVGARPDQSMEVLEEVFHLD